MKTAISLKQLRTDPRQLVRLLKNGYEVSITEHRRPLVCASASQSEKLPKRGDPAAILKAIRALGPIKTPHPQMDTVELIKRTRLEGYEAKRRQIDKQHGRS